MSQDIFDSIDPSMSGTDLATTLNSFKDAIVSGCSGTSRPTELQPGGAWIDTSGSPNTWSYKVWTGVDDVEVFVIDLSVGGGASVSLAVDSFIVRKVSADTVGAILNLVKRRIATNGQVLSGDVVGEVRMIGRDNLGADPIVAKIMFTAAEDQTSSAYGGTLSFHSTPAGTAAMVEHMRFIGGLVETLVPLKLNAEILTGQNVATAATISQLSADKILVEFTGATGTSVQGVNSGHASKVVNLHNRSSASVTLKHQDTGAAANDRMAFPEGRDVVLLPQDSVAIYYCTTDTRWKLLYASARFAGFTTDTIYGVAGEWDAPTTVSKIRLVARSKSTVYPILGSGQRARVLDVGKSAFAWGANLSGNLGVGDITPRSSPVAVLGGLKFTSIASVFGTNASNYGLTENGAVYAWGGNTSGQLGVGDVLPRSSPVAVLGGLKFKSIVTSDFAAMGLTEDGSAYAWGLNFAGSLGVGDVVPRSSPVAVVGGLKFRKIVMSAGDGIRAFGITFDGLLYAWGDNGGGALGTGDITPRSSPVAVLGGLRFKDVFSSLNSTYAIAENGDGYAWGNNDLLSGNLGVGDTNSRSTPTAIVGGLKFQKIMAPFDGFFPAVIGLTEGGAAYAWGINDHGQIGDGSVVQKSTPTLVLGGKVFKDIDIQDSSVWGLATDGLMYGWGRNEYGQLGLGDVTPRSSPVAVVGGLTFQEMDSANALAAFNYNKFKIALTTDGRQFAWGANNHGQLGLGDVTDRSSPVAVLSGLQLKTQDDFDTVLDIPVVGGDTYALKLGAGPCFFGNKPIGNNIYQAEITYVP